MLKAVPLTYLRFFCSIVVIKLYRCTINVFFTEHVKCYMFLYYQITSAYLPYLVLVYGEPKFYSLAHLYVR